MRTYILLLSIGISQAVAAQPPVNWQLLDWKHDGYPGMSVEKAYSELLAGKKPRKKIVVAVIDDGQLKQCIEGSAVPIDVLVTQPNTNKKVAFRSLSRSGGIVNAYRAIQLAQQMVAARR